MHVLTLGFKCFKPCLGLNLIDRKKDDTLLQKFTFTENLQFENFVEISLSLFQCCNNDE